MAQLNVAENVTTVTVESLPVIAYKGQPVITSKALAALYGVEPVNIRKNLSKNKDRFFLGKHFFKVSSRELRGINACVTESNADGFGVPDKTRGLTLWTARGAARHAKMLHTDAAWEVFEKLEDCYFSQTADTAPEPTPSRLTTAKERNQLAVLVNRYVGALSSGPHAEAYKAAWRKVHDVMGIKRIEDLTVEQLPRAVVFMTALVEALPAGEERKALPGPSEDLRTAMVVIHNAYRPELRTIEEAIMNACAHLRIIEDAVNRAAYAADGSTITIDTSLAQQSKNLVADRVDTLRHGIRELESLARLGFAGIAVHLELRHARNDLRQIEKDSKGRFKSERLQTYSW